MKEPTEEQIITPGDNEKAPSTNEQVGPTREELETLPRIADKIPYTIFMVVIAEAAERFTFRSITGPLQNYVQNPLHDDRLPGALGKVCRGMVSMSIWVSTFLFDGLCGYH